MQIIKHAITTAAAAWVLFMGAAALAQEASDPPDRRWGGCTRDGFLCAGPSVAASLAVINLGPDKTSRIRGGFVPGAGYGVTAWASEWYNVGAAFHLSLVMGGDAPAVITPAVVVSFAEYMRVGVGLEYTDGGEGRSSRLDPLILFGLGLDFGTTPGAQERGIMSVLRGEAE